MLTQQSPRGRVRGAGLSKLVMHGDATAASTINALIARAPLERREDPASFLGHLCHDEVWRGNAERTASVLPERLWLTSAKPQPPAFPKLGTSGDIALDTDGLDQVIGIARPSKDGGKPQAVLFPSRNPASRAEVFFLADAVDRLLAEIDERYDPEPSAPSAPQPHVFSDDTDSSLEGTRRFSGSGSGSAMAGPPPRPRQRHKSLAVSLNVLRAPPKRGQLDTATTAERLRDIGDALFIGLLEASRVAGFQMAELGELTRHLADSVRALVGTYQDVLGRLKAEVAVARGYDPAKQLEEMQNLIFAKETQIEALQRERDELRRERVGLREEAAAAATWKKARDDMAAVLCRQALRNQQLLQLERDRIEAERQARLAEGLGADDVDASGPVATFADRAVQVQLDAPFERKMGGHVKTLFEAMAKQMTAVEGLCAPFYTSAGLTSLTRPATVALSRLDDLIRRTLDSDSRGLAAAAAPPGTGGPSGGTVVDPAAANALSEEVLGVVAAPITKELLSRLLEGCDVAAQQVTSRITALAERTDIRKLAHPLQPPTDPNEPCALCHRVDVDPAILDAARELERVSAQAQQHQRSIELLHAERMALQEELELANARIARRRERQVDQAVVTDPVSLGDGSPPLQINLIIDPHGDGDSPRGATSRSPSHRRKSVRMLGRSGRRSPQAGSQSQSSGAGGDSDAASPAVDTAVRVFRRLGEAAKRRASTATSSAGGRTGGAGPKPSPPAGAADALGRRKSRITFADGADSPASQGGAGNSPTAPGGNGARRGTTASDGSGIGGASLRRGADSDPNMSRALTWSMVTAIVANHDAAGGDDAAAAAWADRDDQLSTRPVSHVLRTFHQVMAAKAAADRALGGKEPPPLRDVLLEHERGAAASRKAALVNAASLIVSIRAYASSDPRVALFAALLLPEQPGPLEAGPDRAPLPELLPDNAFQVAARVSAALDALVAKLQVAVVGGRGGTRGAGGGIVDTARSPAAVPVSIALAALAVGIDAAATGVSWLQPSRDALVAAAIALGPQVVQGAFLVPEPCRAVAHQEAVKRVQAMWGDAAPAMPSDAVYRKVMRADLLHTTAAAVAALDGLPERAATDAAGARVPRTQTAVHLASVPTFTAPQESASAAWNVAVEESDGEDTASEP